MADPRPAEPTPAGCAYCGASVVGPLPLSWSTADGPHGRSVFCAACTRRHVRSMEAQLEQEHW